MKECEGRIDQLAIDLKGRIVLAGDLRAVESKYHRQCYQNFKTNQSSSGTCSNSRNLDSTKEEAFSQLCYILEENLIHNKQYTLDNLRKIMVVYLPSDVPPYSCKQIKRKLIEHYGSQINISALDGVQNVISFKDTAANIL